MKAGVISVEIAVTQNAVDNYKFFQNKNCEWFPCHDTEYLNCLFCFCPLYPTEACGGEYKILKNGLKDCSNCLLPHSPGGYDTVIETIIENNKKSEKDI